MKLRPFPLLTLVLTTGLAVAQEPKQHIDVGKLPQQARIIEDVIVPNADEVFGVLDKLGQPNWHRVLQSDEKFAASGGRAHIALLLGSVIAEGFIAVEAQEPEEVKKIGRSVLDLSNALNVRKTVVARSNAIIEAADKKDWPRARKELDGAQQDVKSAMHELKDDELAQLVSLGGWLRGTEGLTTVIRDGNYPKDSVELLHQPSLLEYFDHRLSSLSGRFAKEDVVGNIKKRLPEIRPLIGEGSADISKKSVDQIHDIVSELVKSIRSK
jgi:hypothetical protein